MQIEKTKQAYIVTVDMGYGHQRAVYPLRHLAAPMPGATTEEDLHIINANVYPGIPKKDQRFWESSRRIYEIISRFKKFPVIGTGAFWLMDYLQRINPFYPKQDWSAPTAQVKSIYSLIRRGWGKHLIDELNRKPLPYITSFFSTAFFAEEHGYKGEIYCICTDTDISRAWAPLVPQKSRINYFVPNKRVRDRLQLYGVKQDHIFVTGFPLPMENVGNKTLQTLKESLGCRITNLDPKGRYQHKYKKMLHAYLGARFCRLSARHPFTVTFAVGGAGAQREIGAQILRSLSSHIENGSVRLNLVAGVRQDIYRYYQQVIEDIGLSHCAGENVKILFDADKMRYFTLFNDILRNTDILWTKPSELSFYVALGIPIIIAPPVGSQEEFNQSWILQNGAGFPQEDPRYTHEWLFDWLESGWLAEAAVSGFLNAPHQAVTHIESMVFDGIRSEIEQVHLL